MKGMEEHIKKEMAGDRWNRFLGMQECILGKYRKISVELEVQLQTEWTSRRTDSKFQQFLLEVDITIRQSWILSAEFPNTLCTRTWWEMLYIVKSHSWVSSGRLKTCTHENAVWLLPSFKFHQNMSIAVEIIYFVLIEW